MEDPEFLRLILLRSDNQVLEVLSKTGLWNIMKIHLENQHFWFLRVQSLPDLLPFLEEWNENENWHQVYNILASTLDGSDPFNPDSDVLERNEYNPLALKWLLSKKNRFDPSVEYSFNLNIASVYGSPESVQLLLSDPRIDPIGNKQNRYIAAYWCLVAATKYGRVDNIQVLLADKRIEPIFPKIMDEMIKAAIRYDQLESMKFIFSLSKNASHDKDRLMLAAVEEDSVNVFSYLLDTYGLPMDRGIEIIARTIQSGSNQVLLTLIHRGIVQQKHANDLINRSIEYGQSEILFTLLNIFGSRFTGKELLRRVSLSRMRSRRAIDRILEDKKINTNDIVLAIQNSVYRSKENLIALLEDKRASNVGLLLVGMLGIIMNQEESDDTSSDSDDQKIGSDIIEVLIRSKQIDLDQVSNEILSTIMKTREVPEDLQKIILKKCTDYNECHYNLLIREIIIEQRDYPYYLDWLIERMSREDTSQEVRDLISSAAGSILSEEEVIHTSDLFTAYSGFFLLANSKEKDIEAIMNTLSEEGVTQNGLDMARILVESFLNPGKKEEKIDSSSDESDESE